MPDASIHIATSYRFTNLSTSRSVTVLRDAAAPKITGFGGRWTVVNVPRRTSFVTWDGTDLWRMDVPVLFDGFDNNKSLESDIALLNHMKLPPNDLTPPPQVTIEGAVPVGDSKTKWVVEDITWGDNIIYHPKGFRLRQDAVVHLLLYVAPDNLAIKPQATSHTYAVKKGDTLKSISKSQYGTPKYWSAIKKANNIRDPKKLPKTLRIPQIIGS